MFQETLDGEYWKLKSVKRERNIIKPFLTELPTQRRKSEGGNTKHTVISSPKKNKVEEQQLQQPQKLQPNDDIIELDRFKIKANRIVIVPLSLFLESHPEFVNKIRSRNEKKDDEEDLPLTQEIIKPVTTTTTKRGGRKSIQKNNSIERSNTFPMISSNSDKSESLSESVPIPIPIPIPPQHTASKIYDGCNVWVGGKSSLLDSEWINKENVKSFVNVTSEVSIPKFLDNESYRTLRIKISDSECEPIHRYFQSCVDFIHESLTKDPCSGVLIHCKEGRSRSTTIAIVYGMIKLKLSLKDAYRLVASACPRININTGFLFQLMNFEKSINNGENTIDFFTSQLRRANSLNQ